MKKWFFATGIILIIMGLIAVTIAWSPSEVKNYKKVSEVSQKWSVSVNLTRGQLVWVEIRQHMNWSIGLFDFDDELYPGFAILYVDVDITDPYGGTTRFLIVLGRLRTTDASPMLTIVDLNVTRNDGGLDPTPFLIKGNSIYYSDVGGIVQYNGTYTFTVGNIYPPRNDPPSSIWIGERITWVGYPFMYMLPVGLAVSGAGTILIWFSLKKKISNRKKRRI